MIGILGNIQTGSVTPQFHVVFDELFSTVHSLDEDDPTWVELIVSERDYYGPDEEEEDAETLAFPDLEPAWLLDSEVRPIPIARAPDNIDPKSIITAAEPPPTEADYTGDIEDDVILTDESSPNDPDESQQAPTEVPVRSARVRRPNQRVFGEEWANHTVRLTPPSRTLLGHIVPTLNHDDHFFSLWIGTRPSLKTMDLFTASISSTLNHTISKSTGSIHLPSPPRPPAQTLQLSEKFNE